MQPGSRVFRLRTTSSSFRQVSEWVVHLVVSQSGHPASRRAVLGCVLRTAQESWNIGNFNGVMEILLGLR